MSKWVIGRPFPGGLCYMVAPMVPLFPPTWVPEVALATRFDTEQEAINIAMFIAQAVVEEIIVEDSEGDEENDDES